MIPYLYCGPGIIKYVTKWHSDERVLRRIKYVTGQRSPIRGMAVAGLMDVFRDLGYECVENKSWPELRGLSLNCLKVKRAIYDEHGCWVIVVYDKPGWKTQHVIIVSNEHYKDNSSGDEWRPITELGNVQVVDMWSLTVKENINDTEAATQTA